MATSTLSEDAKNSSGRWIPLESNPDVMNSWAKHLGLSTKVNCFEDVYGLDAELLALVPKPSKALVLCFPLSSEMLNARDEEDLKIVKEGQIKLDPTIVFIEQIIPNACGTIGLLHAIGNSDVTIEPLSPLAKFFKQIQPLNPGERAELLASTDLFASAHVTAATLGQSHVPSAQDDTNLHYVAFVQASSDQPGAQKRVVELDGRRPHPVDHGPVTNFLENVANVIRTKFIPFSTSQEFGLISLGPPAP